MEFFDEALAVLQRLVRRLDQLHGRQTALVLAASEAAAAGVEADPHLIGNIKLPVDDVLVRAAGECEVMVKQRRAAVLDEFAHGNHGAVVNVLRVDLFPHIVQIQQPIKQLRLLDAGDVPGERLQQMMVRVDEAGVDEFTLGVDHFCVFTGDILGNLDDLVAVNENIPAPQQPILRIAGDNGFCIFN